MAHKHLLFRTEAREKILRGVNALGEAVRVTLGPRLRCALEENLGAQMIKEAAELVSDAMEKVGREGVISLEKAKATETETIFDVRSKVCKLIEAVLDEGEITQLWTLYGRKVTSASPPAFHLESSHQGS